MDSTVDDTSVSTSPAIPLYRQVEAFVRRSIAQGELRPGQRLNPTTLARQTRISRPVVQQALQNLSSQGVLIRRPGSGTYVSEIANGSPSGAASAREVVLVVPHVRVPEYARLADGLGEMARERGFRLSITGTGNSLAVYEESIRRHLDAGVPGLVLVPPLQARLPLSLVNDIVLSGLPVVCCYRRVDGTDWPLVVEDTEQAGRAVADHLIAAGRRRLAFITLDASDFSELNSLSFRGFSGRVLQSMGQVQACEELIIDGAQDMRDWKRNDHLLPAIRSFIEAHPTLDGFFCASDMLANAVCQVLRSMGKSLPDDAAVVGHGGNTVSYSGGIGTVDYSYQRFGKEIFDLLHRLREGGKQASRETVYIPGELQIMESIPE